MKRYTQALITVVTILITNISLAGGGGGGQPVKTVNACQGEITNCNIGSINVRMANVGLNAVGDKLTFDTSKVSVTNFGQITSPFKANVAITSEGQKMFAFTPTQGSRLIKDKEIKILFYAFNINDMPKGLSNANIYTEATNGKTQFPWAKSMLKIYRQLPGEQQWTELAASFSDAAFSSMKPFTVELFPDARAIINTAAHRDENGNLIQPLPMTTDLSKLF